MAKLSEDSCTQTQELESIAADLYAAADMLGCPLDAVEAAAKAFDACERLQDIECSDRQHLAMLRGAAALTRLTFHGHSPSEPVRDAAVLIDRLVEELS